MINLTAKFRLAASPATPEEIAQLREYLSMVPGEGSDALLGSLFTGARGAVEDYCGRVFRSGSWRCVFGGNGTEVMLPLYPVTSVISVVADGVALEPTDSSLSERAGAWRLSLNKPVSASLAVDVTAGYSEAMPPPDAFLSAILMLAADMHEHRESQSEKSLAENRTMRFLLEPLMFYQVG